ncbi:MAG: transcriptional regulator, partial [Ilumatobacteraceae bacterium]|nr:transcriptional regulator [Ilumatobacteraceae bacterium]
LRRTITLTGDATLQAILDEVMGYPNVSRIAPLAEIAAWDEPPLLVPFRFETPAGEVSLFTTLTTFGTPLDVTIDELAIELFFPNDDASDALLRAVSEAGAST